MRNTAGVDVRPTASSLQDTDATVPLTILFTTKAMLMNEEEFVHVTLGMVVCATMELPWVRYSTRSAHYTDERSLPLPPPMARLVAHIPALNLRTNPPCTTTIWLHFLHYLPTHSPLAQYLLCILYSK